MNVKHLRTGATVMAAAAMLVAVVFNVARARDADEAVPAGASTAERTAAGGYKIAVVAGSPSDGSLYVVDADGGNARRLIEGGMNLLPAWSPDGQQIAILALRQEDFDPKYNLAFHWCLYVVDAASGKARKVSATPVFMFYQWSPDGKRFVFQSSYEDPRNNGKEGIVSSAIYVMDADGKNQKRLTEILGHAEWPAWSPDGKQISYTTRRAAEVKNFVMNADGSGQKEVPASGEEGVFPAKTPQSIRLVEKDGEVYVVKAEGRIQKKLTDKDDEAVDFVLSSDGLAMFYRAKAKDGRGLFSVDVDGGNRKQLVVELGTVTSFGLSRPEIRKP